MLKNNTSLYYKIYTSLMVKPQNFAKWAAIRADEWDNSVHGCHQICGL